jgi:copper chaperone CopZ
VIGSPSTGAEDPRLGAGPLETVRFPVAGMTCSSCVNRITRSLRRVEGVDRIRVDLGRETVTVRRDPGVASNGAIAAAITGAGYDAALDSAVIVPTDDRPGLLSRLAALVRPAPALPRE